MRALILTSSFPRWKNDDTTTFVSDLAQDLSGLGWEITVLAPHHPGAREHEYMNQVEICRFRYAWPVRAETLCYDGGALVKLRDHPQRLGKVPMYVAAAGAATLSKLRHGYDVVNSHWLLPQGLVAGIAGSLTRTPHVATVHGGDVFDLRQRVLQPFKRSAIKRSDWVTVNSTATRNAVLDLLPGVENVALVPMGGDSTEPAPEHVERWRKTIGTNGPVVLFAGRLIEEKGILDLALAWPEVITHHPEARLVVAGAGPAREALETSISSACVEHSVKLLGWVEHEEIPSLMRAATMLVGPSKPASTGWVEAMGISLVEAAMAGIPVVATDTGGVRDVVQHGQTGLGVTPGRHDELARAINELLDQPEARLAMGATARKAAIARYSRERSAKEMATVYERAIQGS